MELLLCAKDPEVSYCARSFYVYLNLNFADLILIFAIDMKIRVKIMKR